MTPAVSRRSSLDRSLALLVAACVLPSSLALGILAFDSWHTAQGRIHDQAVAQARSLMASIDRALARVESGLEVLATSEDLRAGRLEAFQALATAAVPSQIVYNYLLTDADGHQKMNTLVPWGRPLPTVGTPAALAEVFRSGRPVLTDWFIGPVTGKPALAMGVPVVVDGRTIYSLNIGLTPAKLEELLAQSSLPPQWVASILDSRGVILARTRDGPKFEGTLAVASIRAELAQRDEGSLEAVTVDGMPVVTAFSRSSRWGWASAVGIPKAALEAELGRIFTWTALGVLLAIGAGAWLAGRLARRVSGAIRDLNSAALSLTGSGPFRPPRIVWEEAAAVGQALEQASQLLSREHHQATHDALTGLANRALFDELLRHAFGLADRGGAPIALISLDLDGFKGVNDTLGHTAGDDVLRGAAERVRASLRSSDTAARLGGDEFAVLLSGCDRASALLVAGRLVQRLSEPYPGAEHLVISASAGVAVYPGAGTGLPALIEAADRALYRAKDAGKRCVASEPLE